MTIVLLIILGLLLIANLCLVIYSRCKCHGGSDSDEIGSNLDKALKDNRLELNNYLKNSTDSLIKQFNQLQKVLSDNLKELREDNHKQLDRMRQTVDEKLQSTLEKRLTESFKLVNQQLETVNKNMGEMQALASDVGELQHTLTGVKTRGIWGEAHLDNLLSEVLNPEQYVKEFQPNPSSSKRVEFALKIPADNDQFLYLPIDAKFPLSSFTNLQTALKNNQQSDIDKARKSLQKDLKVKAKEISKYIHPPLTTNFACMYLPLESLYAEVAQNTTLIDELRQKYQIAITGPTTILPMLAMLNLGYKSLTIQKRVSEVWQILIETQQEFTKFGDLMDKASKKLNEASSVINDASTKTRTIEGKFKKVQRLKDQE